VIGSISSGGGFGGLLGYLLAPAKDPEIIGGNVLGFQVAAIAREFHRTARKNPRVLKPVRHISISFAQEDGEINETTKEEIAHEIMVEMGYLLRADELPSGKENNAQYLVVNHGRQDPDHDRSHNHDHFHIMANAVNLSGKWVSNSFDYQRLEKVLRKLEEKHGLRQIACSWEKDKVAPTHGQQQRWMKETEQVAAGTIAIATPPISEQLQDLILKVSQDRPTLAEYLDRLARAGVNMRTGLVTVSRRDRLTQALVQSPTIGLSYEFQGVKFAASDLKASVNQLVLRQRVTFDPVGDFPRLCLLESIEQSKSTKANLQRAIDYAAIGRPSMTMFVQRLQQMGVQPKFRITNNRQPNIPGDLRVSGVSYEMNGQRWAGSQLLNGSWPKLLAVKQIGYSEAADGMALYEVSKGIDRSAGLEKIEIVTETPDFSGAVVAIAPVALPSLPAIVGSPESDGAMLRGLSPVREDYLQVAIGHALKLLADRDAFESSRVVVGWEEERLVVWRKRPEKRMFTAVLDEDGGGWMAIGPTDINLSDVQLLERQAKGRKKQSQPGAGVEISLEERSVSVQLEQGELFRDIDQVRGRGVDRSI
jgi:Relaxase/Mobilisation nuclease domain